MAHISEANAVVVVLMVVIGASVAVGSTTGLGPMVAGWFANASPGALSMGASYSLSDTTEPVSTPPNALGRGLEQVCARRGGAQPEREGRAVRAAAAGECRSKDAKLRVDAVQDGTRHRTGGHTALAVAGGVADTIWLPAARWAASRQLGGTVGSRLAGGGDVEGSRDRRSATHSRAHSSDVGGRHGPGRWCRPGRCRPRARWGRLRAAGVGSSRHWWDDGRRPPHCPASRILDTFGLG